jgi:hypothetical protein
MNISDKSNWSIFPRTVLLVRIPLIFYSPCIVKIYYSFSDPQPLSRKRYERRKLVNSSRPSLSTTEGVGSSGSAKTKSPVSDSTNTKTPVSVPLKTYERKKLNKRSRPTIVPATTGAKGVDVEADGSTGPVSKSPIPLLSASSPSAAAGPMLDTNTSPASNVARNTDSTHTDTNFNIGKSQDQLRKSIGMRESETGAISPLSGPLYSSLCDVL